MIPVLQALHFSHLLLHLHLAWIADSILLQFVTFFSYLQPLNEDGADGGICKRAHHGSQAKGERL